ncbi:hypothetical protein P7C73_g1804, partial [Tremellales sp. Uapishka_1]
MRLNENTVICGDKVILVPYRPEHVPTYHEWMKSPELLELTASEPLTFDEELAMQKKWHLDHDSMSSSRCEHRWRMLTSSDTLPELTFILLARSASFPSTECPVLSPKQLQKCRMVGDVNMFLPDGPDEDGECEIMIASPSDRRSGYASEALTLFLSYAIATLPIAPTHLIARIGTKNRPSINLFSKLGFGNVKVVQVWNEAEMRWGWNGEIAAGEWTHVVPPSRIGPYDSPVPPNLPVEGEPNPE